MLSRRRALDAGALDRLASPGGRCVHDAVVKALEQERLGRGQVGSRGPMGLRGAPAEISSMIRWWARIALRASASEG
jgi:hypothetical protein